MLPDRRKVRIAGPHGAALVCAVFAVAGCDALALLRDPIEPEHARYAAGLAEAGLAATTTGRAWIDAGESALVHAEPATLPHRSEGWIAADAPAAVAYRFERPDARWITIRATLAGAEPGRLFVEAFRMPTDPDDGIVPVASAEADADEVSFRVRGRGDLVVRIQPELLRGGAWTLEVTAQDETPARAGPP